MHATSRPSVIGRPGPKVIGIFWIFEISDEDKAEFQHERRWRGDLAITIRSIAVVVQNIISFLSVQ
jgi:hypothetical protein